MARAVKGGRGLRRRRLLWVLSVAALFCGGLAARLVEIQVAQRAFLTTAANNAEIRTFTLTAPRGEILDRYGHVLAMDVPGYQVTAVPRLIAHPGQVSRVLARYLPFSAQQIDGAITANRHGWYVLLDRSVSPGVANRIAARRLVGIDLVPTSVRTYPDGTLASQVLGFVGANHQGAAGLELADNRVLAGHNGYTTVDTDVFGHPLPQYQIAHRAPVAGDNLELTLDANIEAQAQKWLKWGVKRVHALGGTVIVLDPKTGAILALANYPDFNPANYYQATAAEMNDFAVQDPVPPGSIFKPITAAAALSLGLVTPNTTFDTRGYKIVDGVRINDWKPGGWGWINMTHAFAYSSDQVFMDLGLKLGVANFYRYVKAFGLMHASGVGLPGDSGPIWLPAAQVNAVDLATMAFGQGMAITPLSMAAALAGIVNNGTLMQPRIVRAVVSPTGQVLQRFAPKVESRPISPTVAQEIQHMMVAEATYGTGVPANLPGYVIGGKTGTAQKVIGGRTSNTRMVASYVGFAPYPHPRFLMLVMVNQPDSTNMYYGDQVAAPIWQHIAMFMMRYWKIAPYATANNGSAPAG